MGTLPIEEDLTVFCLDGRTVTVSVNTTTGDLSEEEGLAIVYGRYDDGRTFDLGVPLRVFGQRWFRRLCDAIAASPSFRDSLIDLNRIDETFVVPAAPNRDLGAVAALLRLGDKAKFRDYAALRSGRDRFTSMRLPALEAEIDIAVVAEARRGMAEVPEEQRDADVARVLRWVLRGLPLAMAIRKVEVDREISTNAR